MIETLAKLADRHGLWATDIVACCETSLWAWDLLEAAGLEEAGMAVAVKADQFNREQMLGLREQVEVL